MPKTFHDRFRFVFFRRVQVTKKELRYGGLSLSLIHIPARFRSCLTRRRGYTIITERYPYRFIFFYVEVSYWLQKDIIIDSISLENCSNAREVLLLALSPEFTAVFDTFARYKRPLLVHYQRLFSCLTKVNFVQFCSLSLANETNKYLSSIVNFYLIFKMISSDLFAHLNCSNACYC